MKRKSNKKSSKLGGIKRALRSLTAIVILTTLVLGISLLVKEASTLNSQKLTRTFGPYLAQVGLSEDKVGEVAGYFASRVSETSITSSDNTKGDFNENPIDTTTSVSAITQDSASANKTNNETKNKLFSFSVLADSHSDINNLSESLSNIRKNNDVIYFHLGDHTDLGVKDKLQEAKDTLDTLNIDYYALPGDRDLWQSVGPENFEEIFGEANTSFEIQGVKFVLIDNSANFTTLSANDMSWAMREIESADFVLTSQPLYHPTNNKIMGVADGEQVKTLKEQANTLLEAIRKSNVKAVISAEHHISGDNPDPQKPSLRHIIVGAVTSTINDKPQSMLQSSRFSRFSVYEDGTFSQEEVILSTLEK